ncbi:MAG: prephenate dehydrogenase [Flavobacteriaceae bacterium]|nr:prephenate dehydrogenase [Flavobacteriaceae bacterium]
MERVAVIGLGLIGGSLSLDIKEVFGSKIIGIDGSLENAEKALSLGIIDEISTIENLTNVDVVIIATPVDTVSEITKQVLNVISDDTLVFDVGSVKEEICLALENHPKRVNFVAAHPIAGTEFSGPDAAIRNLFRNKINILCDIDKSKKEISDKAFLIFEKLGMKLKFMKPAEHDRHIAYVSHLSHVSSFMLGKTVLEIEKDEQNIFDMAGSGFESTVRLAKSSPSTWTPIFTENKKNLLSSLDEYIKNLVEFRSSLKEGDKDEIFKMMKETNHLKEILNGINKNY